MKFYGVGANSRKFDFPATHLVDGKWTNAKAYTIWSSMLKRCYEDGGYEQYKDVYVSEEWLDYQDFAMWYSLQPEFRKMKGWQLDKDILNRASRVYSPENCKLVPIEVNLAVRVMAERSERQGVSWHKRDEAYRAYLKTVDGINLQKCGFQTESEAFSWYKINKEEQLKLLAEKYRGLVDDCVYEALLLMEVKEIRGSVV